MLLIIWLISIWILAWLACKLLRFYYKHIYVPKHYCLSTRRTEIIGYRVIKIVAASISIIVTVLFIML